MIANELLEQIRYYRQAIDEGCFDPDCAVGLANSFSRLDKWLSIGGNLPTDWLKVTKRISED